MEKITFKDFKNGKGFWVDREEDIIILENEGLNDNDIIVNFAYTDYGGDYFDRVVIDYFIEETRQDKKVNFLWHKTAYYGKNAIIYGKLAENFWNDTQNYILGYEGLEDYYFKSQYKIQNEETKNFLNEVKYNDLELTEETKDLCFPYLLEYFEDKSILSSGSIDFCYSEAEEKINDIIENILPLELSKMRELKADSQYIGKIK